MRVLIGCERSGVVRRAFRALGHEAWSCDTSPPEDDTPFHYTGDVLDRLWDGWDLAIFHPPCTYLARSGLHWNKRLAWRQGETERALEFALRLLEAPIPHIAVENPVGLLSTRYQKPTQIIQPYQFGDDASKTTCLWLKGLPKLVPTKWVTGRKVLFEGHIVERWANQTDSGQNNVPNTKNRQTIRSRTYEGIAAAMATQWTVTI